MSDFMSIFQPGLQHLREQRDLDKILIVEAPKGGTGPRPLDLESGVVEIDVPTPRADAGQAEPDDDPAR